MTTAIAMTSQLSQLSQLDYTIFNIFKQVKTDLLHKTRDKIFNYL